LITLVLIFAAAVLNSMALTMLKLAGDQLRGSTDLYSYARESWIFVLIGAVLYGFSFLLTIKIFSENALSRAVPTFIAISILCTSLIGIFYFRESYTNSLLIGGGFIILGVWFIQANPL
tara:strand:+ start:1027 stop:1383 length:357 start_codon:yes stop_codon:yes gene_type:complete